MKKPFMYLLTAGLAISMITTGTVSAAESNATVEFNVPTGSVDVKDPLDPRVLNPDAPNQGTVTGETGPLTLDFVSNLDFGLRDLDLEGNTYNSTTETPYIQVSDRRGPGIGWNVTAQLGQFNPVVDEIVQVDVPSLPGSKIHFENATAISTSTSNEPENINQHVTLENAGDADNIVSALGGEEEEASGLGTWIVRWLAVDEDPALVNSNVALEVPAASATAGEHRAVIDWTLTNGPTQISNVNVSETP